MKNLQLQVAGFFVCRGAGRKIGRIFAGSSRMRGCCRFFRCPAGGAYEIACLQVCWDVSAAGEPDFSAKRGDARYLFCPIPVLPVPPRGPDCRGGWCRGSFPTIITVSGRTRTARFRSSFAARIPDMRRSSSSSNVRKSARLRDAAGRFRAPALRPASCPPDRRGRPRKSRRTVSDSF